MNFSTACRAAALVLALAGAATAQVRLLNVGYATVRGDGAGSDTGPSSTRYTVPPGKQKLVTGNGCGFAVYDQGRGTLSKLHAHPYRFAGPGDKPQDDGPEVESIVTSMRWGSTPGRPTYVEQSHVIQVERDGARESYFMPFGLERCVLLATTEPGAAPAGEAGTAADTASQAATPVATAAAGPVLAITWRVGARPPRPVEAGGLPAWQVSFTDEPESLLVLALEAPAAGAPPATPGAGRLTGSTGWALVPLAAGEDAAAVAAAVRAWQGGARPAELAAREVAELERWRVPPTSGLSAAETALWRQSETVLRMAQIREADGPSRHARGLILASLPDGEWFIPWTRDMAYAIVALTRMGHRDEARLGLTAWMQARPVGKLKARVRNQDYQISLVRYFGDGSEDDDFSGQKRPNLELDSWGLALWAMGEYVSRTGDTGWLAAPTWRGATYAAVRDFVFRPLIACLDAAGDGLVAGRDSGLWEQNDEGYKRYASATIASVAGMTGFAALARAAGDADSAALAARTLARLRIGFLRTFTKDGRLVGSEDAKPRNAMDGALLSAFDFDVVSDPALIQSTFARMEELATPSGGHRRVNGKTDYEAQEFVFIDVNFARMLFRQGQREAAEAKVARLVARAAADHDLIPEMYLSRPAPRPGYEGAVDDPAGAVPMVGYGPGILMMYWMERSAGR